MLEFKVTTVGASSGIILNKAARERLGVEKGDKIFLTPAPGAGFRLTAHDPEFARDMELTRGIMRKRRDILMELAK